MGQVGLLTPGIIVVSRLPSFKRMLHPSGQKPVPQAIRDALISEALAARNEAYAPHSGFPVGAAIKTASGHIFRGFNVENSSYSVTMCAERIAIYAALVAGEREFTHIALVADQDEPLSPCGACRQVLAELAPDASVVMANTKGVVRYSTVKELLPSPFSLSPEER
jgi:cytidine deaminase